MEYYTLLTLGYTLLDNMMYVSIWFTSEDDCWSVLMNNNTLYDQINAQEGYCDVSEVASKIVKPKIRPY
tara:strand:+ start:1076 stop:1282 length:207 start_codon:yes stop_codon:yes gene_type:complete